MGQGPSRQLDQQWIVVTGGSKGIGYGIAERFVDEGACVTIAARNREDLELARERLAARAGPGQTVRSAVLDVADEASVDGFFASLGEDTPRLDVFVANAGAGAVVPFLELTKEAWDRTIGLNLTGTFLCVQRAARAMAAGSSENRSIIVVSSIRALGARPGVLAYATAKAGLNQLVRVSAYELAGSGIRVNALSPGITATPLSDANPDLFRERVKDVPMGRAGSTRDMAEAAVYLARPESGFVTGTNLVVDGGEHLW
ncbi:MULTISPECIES: SDR family NAD(P)-dependent oxidoreductase [unclassified Blastococcus]